MADSALARLLDMLKARARECGLTDSAWAAEAGLPKETLSRLRRRSSCDLTTLLARADAVGASLTVVDADTCDVKSGRHMPASVDRQYEEKLIHLCVSRDLDGERWASCGPAFFMSGLAVMLASEHGFDRRGLLDLAERLHPGASEPEVFARWLDASPVRPSRFLPFVRERARHGPDSNARPEYVGAFIALAKRIEASIEGTSKRVLPIKMFVAGGAALHFYTGERVSRDIDATFSRRIALPEHLEVAYRDADGAARLLYFDRQHNDTFGLLHEDAYDDSEPLILDGIDPAILEIRVLSAVDLAISKLGRFASHDRDDIASLARHKLMDAPTLRRRAEEALAGYVGDVERLRGSIEIACRIVEDERKRRRK